MTVAIVVVVIALAVVVSLVVQRRRPEAPTQGNTAYQAPVQLDRADFAGADEDWLVVVFTSATCSTCAAVRDAAAVLASDSVGVVEVEVGERGDLHERYGIEAVPILVVADREGVVQRSFVGPVSSTHLWAAVAEVREPGSVPPGCGGDHS